MTTANRQQRIITVVWMLLSVLTLVSWLFAHSDEVAAVSRHWGVMGILLVTLIKVRFVIRYFMEVNQAPLALKLVTDGWLLVLALALSTLYLLAGQPPGSG
ncbi:MAG: cytochrome C oxidase subunit IV family protein [Pseudomonadales bacterium]